MQSRHHPPSSRQRQAAFLLSILLALTAPSLAAAGTGDIVWGVNGHPLTNYRDVTANAQIDLVAQLGMRAYRVDVTNLAQMDALATLVTTGRAKGVAILPVLNPPVDLAKDDVATIGRVARDFGQNLASRFRGEIGVWELGNELENTALVKPCETRDDGTVYPCNWGDPGGTIPNDYAGPRVAKIVALLRGLSDGVRAGDPAARRAIGSAGWGHTAIFDRYRDAGLTWDITVWHAYTPEIEASLKRLKTFGKPIWITEFDHPFGSAKDGEAGQARGIETMIARIKALANAYDVEGAFIYELLDEPYWGTSYEASMGLVHVKSGPDGHFMIDAKKAAFEPIAHSIAPDRK
jgi:hypothetical protein